MEMRFVGSAIGILLFSIAFTTACTPKTPAPAPARLHLEPACDLATSEGLLFVADMKPTELARLPRIVDGLERFLSLGGRLFVASGGIDLRATPSLCVGLYEKSVLAIASGPLDGERIAATFEHEQPGSRRTLLARDPRVFLLEPARGKESERLLLFGNSVAAVGTGRRGPLRAAQAIAFGETASDSSALHGKPLERAANVLGRDAPLRVFAVGPIRWEAAKSSTGSLRAASAAGISLRWANGSDIAVRVVLTGPWEHDAPRASREFEEAARAAAVSHVGRTLGLDHPIVVPVVRAEPDALVLDATFDGNAIERGIEAMIREVFPGLERNEDSFIRDIFQR